MTDSCSAPRYVLHVYFHHNAVGMSVFYWSAPTNAWQLFDLYHFKRMDTQANEQEWLAAMDGQRGVNVIVHKRDHLASVNDGLTLPPPAWLVSPAPVAG